MEFQKRVEMKQEQELIMNLNTDIFINKYHENDTISILKHLFTYYSSKFAHCFIEEGNIYNYIPQDAAVEILISSKLAQHILEIIWNESKQDNNKEKETSSDNDSGLNRNEFITALQLISLAQQSLPYNKHYLLEQQHQITIDLPSILVDVGFLEYFDAKYNKQMKNINNRNRKRSKQLLTSNNMTHTKKKGIPYLDPSNTSDASGANSPLPYDTTIGAYNNGTYTRKDREII